MAAVCVFYLAFELTEITNEPQTCEKWYRAPTAAVAIIIIIIIIIIMPATGKEPYIKKHDRVCAQLHFTLSML